jgi:2-oxoglutarate dehydrogenase E2 component (dihydrolipoamide succinyltransferase)
MRVEVKVPQLPESVAEATLVSWHKKVGDKVARDENLVDVETDKVVLELPAPQAGVLVEIRQADGATVTGQQVIAVIDSDAAATAAASSAAAAPPPAAPQAAAQTALPAARKMMADLGVSPAGVDGTGRGGRITKGDVIAATAAAPRESASPPAAARAEARPEPVPAAPPVARASPASSRPEQRVPMSRLRQRVAERLVQSQSAAAILTTFNEVNMQPVIDLRNRYKERFEKEHGVKLGFMGFFVKAVVHALKKFPAVNASIDGTDIIYHGYFDIGIAVGSPRGLVVPILRDADQLSIAEIEKAIADFGKRAQDGKLTVDELTGGTYTISNGGVFGSMLSTPIINPPQSAILGVHATKERAVVENGQVVVRPINYLAQSYDHRIIDGREAVLSLVAIKEALEDPARLLLDL